MKSIIIGRAEASALLDGAADGAVLGVDSGEARELATSLSHDVATSVSSTTRVVGRCGMSDRPLRTYRNRDPASNSLTAVGTRRTGARFLSG